MKSKIRLAKSEAHYREFLAIARETIGREFDPEKLSARECRLLASRAEALYSKQKRTRDDQRRAFVLDHLASYANRCRDRGDIGRDARFMPFAISLYVSATDAGTWPAIRQLGGRLRALAIKTERDLWASVRATRAA
jgi:hypothetical protein